MGRNMSYAENPQKWEIVFRYYTEYSVAYQIFTQIAVDFMFTTSLIENILDNKAFIHNHTSYVTWE